MTDKELLELAAKAAGIEIEYFYGDGDEIWAKHEPRMTDAPGWNPLTDDGDALRLAVKLMAAIEYDSEYLDQPAKNVYVQAQGYDAFEPLCYDPYAATRRAVVRAAAEIGRML